LTTRSPAARRMEAEKENLQRGDGEKVCDVVVQIGWKKSVFTG
jgi:hypothetical protein